MHHQSCSNLIHLLLGVSKLLLTAAIIVPSAAYSLANSLTHNITPRDFDKRQTEEEVCGVDYVLCDINHCCPGGTYCALSGFVWYCPKSSKTSVAKSTLAVDDSGTTIFQYPTTYPTVYITAVQAPSSTVSTGNNNASLEEGVASGGGLQQKVIIGITVGGGILLLIIAGILVFIIRNYNKRKKSPATMRNSTQSPIPPPMSQPQHQDISQQQCDASQYLQQHPLQGQYPSQGQYPAHAPPSPVPQHYDYAGVDPNKQPTLGAGYYQPGYSGAVEAMNEPAKNPSPMTVPQTQVQGVPRTHSDVYEM